MNDCDCRELDEFWKIDLQKHDHDVHENHDVLLFFCRSITSFELFVIIIILFWKMLSN
jgi:hypothetical protein